MRGPGIDDNILSPKDRPWFHPRYVGSPVFSKCPVPAPSRPPRSPPVTRSPPFLPGVLAGSSDPYGSPPLQQQHQHSSSNSILQLATNCILALLSATAALYLSPPLSCSLSVGLDWALAWARWVTTIFQHTLGHLLNALYHRVVRPQFNRHQRPRRPTSPLLHYTTTPTTPLHHYPHYTTTHYPTTLNLTKNSFFYPYHIFISTHPHVHTHITPTHDPSPPTHTHTHTHTLRPVLMTN